MSCPAPGLLAAKSLHGLPRAMLWPQAGKGTSVVPALAWPVRGIRGPRVLGLEPGAEIGASSFIPYPILGKLLFQPGSEGVTVRFRQGSP